MYVLKLPPADYLRQCLSYDPETGGLTWLERPRSMFDSDRVWRCTNNRWAGRPAFTARSDHGLNGRLNGVNFGAHRIIFKLVTGRDPHGEIDHINGDPYDNRWSNLRDVPRSENMKNKAQTTKSNRPYMGVSQSGKRWTAVIGGSSDYKWLGSFATVEEAIAARKGAERALGYHPNHGRRVNDN